MTEPLAPAPTLQSHVNTLGPASQDLGPLVANEPFRARADMELKAAHDADRAASALAAANQDTVGTIQLFAGAVRQLRAIGVRFPETTKFIDVAIAQTQLAMGVVQGNVPPVATGPLAPAQPATAVRSSVTGKPVFVNKK